MNCQLAINNEKYDLDPSGALLRSEKQRSAKAGLLFLYTRVILLINVTNHTFGLRSKYIQSNLYTSCVRMK